MDLSQLDISQFHFLRPQWWLALLPLALALWAYARRRVGSGPWARIVDPLLLPHVVEGQPAALQPWPLVMLGVGGVLAIAALAGPTWSRLPQAVYQSTDGLAIVLDLSRSMEATDLAPSRLKRARFKVADILARRREGQTALVVYAGSPFVVTPLTEDTTTITAQLPALSPQLMPSRGSRADLGLNKAAELLRQAGLHEGQILLITDGVDLGRAQPVAEALRRQGFPLSVLGVGTPQGAPIPLHKGGFLYAGDGSIVISRLDPTQLTRLARAGGGRYRSLTADDSDILGLLAVDARPDPAQARQASGIAVDRWRDEGAWLLLPLLPLAALAFRRGWLLMLVAVVVAPLPRPGHALDWTTLWARPDQQASAALERGEARRAAELFQDPAWRGVAQYRAGDYAGSAHSLEPLDDAQSWYNRGNALAQAGEYREAIRAYDEALKRDADLEDARYNRALVRRQLARQDPPDPQQGQSEDAGEPEDGQQGQGQETQGSLPDQSPRPGTGDPGATGDADPTAEHEPSANPGGQEGQTAGEHAAEGQNEAPAGEPGEGQEGAEPPTGPGEDPAAARAEEEDDAPPDEADQALTQWLRRIPDDPGGLLRRKFYYQYRRQSQEPVNDTQAW